MAVETLGTLVVPLGTAPDDPVAPSDSVIAIALHALLLLPPSLRFTNCAWSAASLSRASLTRCSPRFSSASSCVAWSSWSCQYTCASSGLLIPTCRSAPRMPSSLYALPTYCLSDATFCCRTAVVSCLCRSLSLARRKLSSSTVVVRRPAKVLASSEALAVSLLAPVVPAAGVWSHRLSGDPSFLLLSLLLPLNDASLLAIRLAVMRCVSSRRQRSRASAASCIRALSSSTCTSLGTSMLARRFSYDTTCVRCWSSDTSVLSFVTTLSALSIVLVSRAGCTSQWRRIAL